jgi:hypothetical protein
MAFAIAASRTWRLGDEAVESSIGDETGLRRCFAGEQRGEGIESARGNAIIVP